MFLLELFTDDPEGFRDEKDDKSVLEKPKTRTTRLTLKHLRKLRQMNDVRIIEKSKEMGKISAQYGPQPEDSADAGGGLAF